MLAEKECRAKHLIFPGGMKSYFTRLGPPGARSMFLVGQTLLVVSPQTLVVGVLEVCVCMRVCVRARICMCVWVSLYAYVCISVGGGGGGGGGREEGCVCLAVCECVWVCACIYVCVCVCLCCHGNVHAPETEGPWTASEL